MNRFLLFLTVLSFPIVASATDYYLKWTNHHNGETVKFEYLGRSYDPMTEKNYEGYVATVLCESGALGHILISDDEKESAETTFWGSYIGVDAWYLQDKIDYPFIESPAVERYLSSWQGNSGAGTWLITQVQGKEGGYEYGKTYKFYLKDFGDKKLRIESDEAKDFYLYSDMNRWSALLLASQPVRIFKVDGMTDLTSQIWKPGEAPYYFSEEVLKHDWMFKRCSREELPEAISAVGGEWYKLDLSSLSDLNGNAGRLCGQFKITCGDHGSVDNFGIFNGYDTPDNLLNNGIEANELFTNVAHSNGLQNFHLASSYMDNAVIYFNPRYMQRSVTEFEQQSGADKTFTRGGAIYIDVNEEDVKNTYVYYAVYGSDDFGEPMNATISDLSQINYYTNSKGFNGEESETYNPGNSLFYWEKWDNDGNGVDYDGIHFPYVYRRLIPYGATHRFPVPFNVGLTGYTGTDFPSQQIDCKDLWFIEGEVNIHFRYANGHQPTWVVYNAFYQTFDAEYGIVNGQRYAYGNTINRWQHTDLSLARGPQDDREYYYYNSRKSLPHEFTSGTFAIFQTSEGAVYPVDGVSASQADISAAAINGRDLYYVVPSPDPEIHILYTHLNGTYQLGTPHAEEPFQIEAEFFEPSGDLNTSYDDESIKYAFEVYVRDADNGTQTRVAMSGYTTQPYYEGWQPDAPGLYYVIVKVMKEGRVYTASDIYPVFPADENN